MKIIKVFYIICSLLFSANVYAEEINVSIDKNVITEGDTLYLTIEYDGDSNNSPDLSSLQGDFHVVSNSSSKQITFINGILEQTKKWTIGLKPLKKGKITIKPIKLGDLTSNYTNVEVKEVTNVAYIPDSKNNYNSPYFKIEANTNLSKAYLHQQITMLVTVYDSLGLKNGVINIDETSKDNWIVKSLLKNPVVKQDVIEGRKMNVIKFAFALFPQKTGEIALPQFSFEGEYIKDVGFNISNFDDDFMMLGINFRNPFGQTVPVRMKTDMKNISVLPIPDGQDLTKWLPLDDFQISSTIEQKKGFKVGEAFNQKVELVAYGTTETLLPQINFPQIQGLKQYPEKPVTTEDVINGDIVTKANYNVVYIPTVSGDINIPSIEVNWFNVNKNKFEKTSTESKNIVIEPNNLFNNEKNTPPQQDSSEKEFSKQNEEITSTEKDDKKVFNMFLFFAFCGALVVIVLVGLLLRKHSKNTINHYNKLVIDSILRHDYNQAKKCILEWAKIKFKDDNIKNFKDIIKYTKDTNFEKELDTINKLLYSNSDELFDNQSFIKEFKKINKIKLSTTEKQDVLPNLYK